MVVTTAGRMTTRAANRGRLHYWGATAAATLLLLGLVVLCTGTPAQPTDVRIDERGDGRIRVAWQYAGAASDVVFVVTSSGGHVATVPGAKADATCGAGGGVTEYSEDVAGLVNGQDYTFTVVCTVVCERSSAAAAATAAVVHTAGGMVFSLIARCGAGMVWRTLLTESGHHQPTCRVWRRVCTITYCVTS